jgi:hypothetical protein
MCFFAASSSNSKCANIPDAFYCPEYRFCINNQLFQKWGVAKCKLDKLVATGMLSKFRPLADTLCL